MSIKFIFLFLLGVFAIFLSGCTKNTFQNNFHSEEQDSIDTKKIIGQKQYNQDYKLNRDKLYRNEKYNFTLSFPQTWTSVRGDFNFDEETAACASSKSRLCFSEISFSPDGTRFIFLKIFLYTHSQWSLLPKEKKIGIYVLGKNNDYVFTSDIDPKKDVSNDECIGGGQFDSFEHDRCKEVPNILRTFTMINK